MQFRFNVSQSVPFPSTDNGGMLLEAPGHISKSRIWVVQSLLSGKYSRAKMKTVMHVPNRVIWCDRHPQSPQNLPPVCRWGGSSFEYYILDTLHPYDSDSGSNFLILRLFPSLLQAIWQAEVGGSRSRRKRDFRECVEVFKGDALQIHKVGRRRMMYP